MKLKQLVKIVEQVCLAMPNVRSFISGDVYELNSLLESEYSAMVLSQNTHTVDLEEGVENYSFHLFYVDRLTSDDSNRLDVQSEANDALITVLGKLDELGIVSRNLSINTFKERFSASCSGAFASFNITLDIDDCLSDLPSDIENKITKIIEGEC